MFRTFYVTENWITKKISVILIYPFLKLKFFVALKMLNICAVKFSEHTDFCKFITAELKFYFFLSFIFWGWRRNVC